MNLKLCKKLRRQAEAATVGAPGISYIVGRGGSAELNRRCTRYAYKQLKKAALAT
jgi:hypothetical protein